MNISTQFFGYAKNHHLITNKSFVSACDSANLSPNRRG